MDILLQLFPVVISSLIEEYDYDFEVWHTDGTSDLIYELAPGTFSVRNSYSDPPGGNTAPVALAWNAGYLWLSEIDGDTIYKLDPANGSIITSFAAPGPDFS